MDSDKYSRITYTPRDKIDTVFFESGIQTINYAYNQRGWLETINEGTVGTAAPQDLFAEEVYYYEPPIGTTWPAEFNGNIMGQKIAITGFADGTLHYQYDDLDRLLDVDSLGFDEFAKEDFVYDHNGNRLIYFKHQSIISTDTFNYKYLDGTNLLDSVTGDVKGAYTFDANGNMASDVLKNAYFDYDAYNRMDTVTFLNISIPDNYLAYGYSPGGDRISKHYQRYWQDDCGGGGPPPAPLSSSSGGPGGPGATSQSSGPGGPGGGSCTFNSSTFTYYIRSKGKVIAEYGSLAAGANPTHRFIYAGDQRIAMRTSLDKLHYYLSDHLGSTRMVIDSAGNIMDNHTYYSFGETKSEVTATGQSYKYTGKPLDDEGGLNLHYYGARYYDGASGRFCAVDPFAVKYPELSPFIYAGNDPISYIDIGGKYRTKYRLITSHNGFPIAPYHSNDPVFEQKKSLAWIIVEPFIPGLSTLDAVAGERGMGVASGVMSDLFTIAAKFVPPALVFDVAFSLISVANGIGSNYGDPQNLGNMYWSDFGNLVPCATRECADARILWLIWNYKIEGVKKNGAISDSLTANQSIKIPTSEPKLKEDGTKYIYRQAGSVLEEKSLHEREYGTDPY